MKNKYVKKIKKEHAWKPIAVVLIILTASLVLAGCSDGPGKYDEFAQCLSEKDATMYGTDWCSHCKEQKSRFGSSFKYVYYVNCDLSKDMCMQNGIKGYPTWIINDTQYRGKQSLARLGFLTGCELEEQNP